jgi:predicted aspartyl protease
LWPVAASAQHITANTPQTPVAGQDSASIAARTDAAEHLTVPVLINGHGPFNMVVDTGAERSVISDTLAAALNLPREQNVIVQGIIKAMTVGTVRAETLSFGPFKRDNVLLPVLPQATLAADGYLGLDVINGTRVTFDFKARAVRIDQPHGYLPPDNPELETRVSARGKAGRLQIVDCLVDSVASVAFIDTGAEVSVGNGALLDALKSRRKVGLEVGGVTLTGVTGGEMQGDLISVGRIRLEELSFTDGILAIADVPDFATWDLQFRPAVLIGMNYLRQFASVSVDYRAKLIRFELSLAPPNPRPGVVLRALG